MSSPRPAGLVSFLRFSLLAYGPVWLFELLFGWGYLLSLGLASGSTPPAAAPERAFQLQVGLALAVPIAVMVLVHRAYQRTPDEKRRAWLLYLGWLPIVLVIGLVFSAALGGVSQAVAEDAAGGPRARYTLYLATALKSLVLAHLFIIPGVLIAVRLLKRADPQDPAA